MAKGARSKGRRRVVNLTDIVRRETLGCFKRIEAAQTSGDAKSRPVVVGELVNLRGLGFHSLKAASNAAGCANPKGLARPWRVALRWYSWERPEGELTKSEREKRLDPPAACASWAAAVEAMTLPELEGYITASDPSPRAPAKKSLADFARDRILSVLNTLGKLDHDGFKARGGATVVPPFNARAIARDRLNGGITVGVVFHPPVGVRVEERAPEVPPIPVPVGAS